MKKKTSNNNSSSSMKSPLLRGWICILLGLTLSFPGIPGPGIPLIIAGLFYLSQKYSWPKPILFWIFMRLEKGHSWSKNKLLKLKTKFPNLHDKFCKMNKKDKKTFQIKFPKLYKFVKSVSHKLEITQIMKQAKKDYEDHKKKINCK